MAFQEKATLVVFELQEITGAGSGLSTEMFSIAVSDVQPSGLSMLNEMVWVPAVFQLIWNGPDPLPDIIVPPSKFQVKIDAGSAVPIKDIVATSDWQILD